MGGTERLANHRLLQWSFTVALAAVSIARGLAIRGRDGGREPIACAVALKRVTISWDERYSAAGYVYGTAPNRWLAEQAPRIRPHGRILCLGEGEGRNAVWLAANGWAVDAVDGSPVALEKARRLAAEHHVTIGMAQADLATYRPRAGEYDAVILVFVHLPPLTRKWTHAAAEEALVPGGTVIIEAFSPRQISYSSGGPRQLDMLYEVDSVRADFPRIHWGVLEEAEIELDEGPLHSGRAAVVRGFGRRVA